MKKTLIGTLVGGLILFIWQFLSWSFLGIHESNLQYTGDQDEILSMLSDKLEEGSYFLPNVPSGTSQADRESMMEPYVGKAWATIDYHEALDMSMGMNMFRGLIADLVAAFLLCFILGKIADLNMQTSVLVALAVGVMSYLTANYIESIWFETNSIPELIDNVVQWGLVGGWLGWWLSRK